MLRENLIVVGFITVLVLIHFPQPCWCKQNHLCDPSSCGNIHNISYPFRLKDDPKNCGHPKYELACENNVTVLYLGFHKHKYLVQSINYPNFTIRLVDSAVKKKGNCSILPQYSLTNYNFTFQDPYSTFSEMRDMGKMQINRPVCFLNCPYPVDCPLYLEIGQCINGVCTANSSFSSSSGIHSYVNAYRLMAAEVRERCSIELMVMMTPWAFKFDNNISFSDIYDAIEYGFELSWFKVGGYCFIPSSFRSSTAPLSLSFSTAPLSLSFFAGPLSLSFSIAPLSLSFSIAPLDLSFSFPPNCGECTVVSWTKQI
ncbi:unnamed protein product [Ilex paraguariensis]|uniref:Wall-associated receptor kinase galacturonan-binding domain-containing protein n=1 Tax=Ilex paraguariensis TaxID=185542 RepID=A0ABC8TBL3_9AQUA